MHLRQEIHFPMHAPPDHNHNKSSY